MPPSSKTFASSNRPFRSVLPDLLIDTCWTKAACFVCQMFQLFPSFLLLVSIEILGVEFDP
jgi:hypothetical protein